MNYQIYPNRIGHKRGGDDIGVLRTGFVEENEDTQARGLADFFAAVTHEEEGKVRFYVFTATDEENKFPNVPLWIGPYSGLSEEIVSVQQIEGA